MSETSRDREEGRKLPGGMPEAPACPFCDGTETELLNAFGPHASVASFWCRSCRSPFEFMKWGGRSDPSVGGTPEQAS